MALKEKSVGIMKKITLTKTSKNMIREESILGP